MRIWVGFLSEPPVKLSRKQYAKNIKRHIPNQALFEESKDIVIGFIREVVGEKSDVWFETKFQHLKHEIYDESDFMDGNYVSMHVYNEMKQVYETALMEAKYLLRQRNTQGSAESLSQGLSQGSAEGSTEGLSQGSVEGSAESLSQGSVEGPIIDLTQTSTPEILSQESSQSIIHNGPSRDTSSDSGISISQKTLSIIDRIAVVRELQQIFGVIDLTIPQEDEPAESKDDDPVAEITESLERSHILEEKEEEKQEEKQPEEEITLTCPICMEDLNTDPLSENYTGCCMGMSCAHLLCMGCWRKNKRSGICPVCRQQLAVGRRRISCDSFYYK